MNHYKYKVFCRCSTFNQADYIKDALEGFCMQQTSFPYVCLIMDDASTDGEQEVIRSYIESHFDINDDAVVINRETDDYRFTFAQHKTNRNCYFLALYLKYNHYRLRKDKRPYYDEWCRASEYQAMCEGDDYWISADKLEKQVTFLDEHPDYSAVFADIMCRNEKVFPPTETLLSQRQKIFTIEDVYRGKVFPINSICVRNDVWRHLGDLDAVKTNGDIKQAYLYVKYGNVYKIDECFSVYRKTGKGLSSQWDARVQFIHDINEWYDFFKQINFPNKTCHVIFQVETTCNYIFSHGLKRFPRKDIKGSMFPERWYIYLGYSIVYPIKYVWKRFAGKVKRLFK